MKCGLLGPNVDTFVLIREPWSEEARIGLRDTFFTAETRMREGVASGKMELFRVFAESHAPGKQLGFLIIERMRGMLFIWCYQGTGVVCLIHQLREYARQNGFEQLSFFTRHRAVIRVLRRYRPREYMKHAPDEIQYVIDVKAAA
jgi:hypothetical protein